MRVGVRALPLRLRGLSLEAVLAQADFIAATMMGRQVIVLVVLASVLNAVLLAISGFQEDIVMGVEGVVGLIYALLAGLIVTGLAEELGSGQAMAYLIHPLTAREYIGAWMLAGPGLLGLSYLLAVAAPVLVASPRLIAYRGVAEPLVYGLGELLLTTLLALLLSIATRSRGKAVLLLLSYLLLAPTLTLLLLAILSMVTGYNVDTEDITVAVSLFHPIVAMYGEYTSTKLLGLLYAYGGSALLSLLLYARAGSMEV